MYANIDHVDSCIPCEQVTIKFGNFTATLVYDLYLSPIWHNVPILVDALTANTIGYNLYTQSPTNSVNVLRFASIIYHVRKIYERHCVLSYCVFAKSFVAPTFRNLNTRNLSVSKIQSFTWNLEKIGFPNKFLSILARGNQTICTF